MDFSSFQTNEQAEDEGVWQTVGDAKFLIARYNNPNMQACMQELYTQNKEKIDMFAALENPTVEQKRESKALNKELNAQAMQKTILLGWENVSLENKPLEYTEENCLRMLRIRNFSVMVINLATNSEAYALKLEEEDAKNSQQPSTGT